MHALGVHASLDKMLKGTDTAMLLHNVNVELFIT